MVVRKQNKGRIKFKRIFDELAEYGLLEDLIKTRFKYFFENDSNFQNDMIDILYQNADEVMPVVEQTYLQKLSSELDNYMEKTEECLNQKL